MLTQLHSKKVKGKHTKKNKTPDSEKSLFENSAINVPAHIKVAGGKHA